MAARSETAVLRSCRQSISSLPVDLAMVPYHTRLTTIGTTYVLSRCCISLYVEATNPKNVHADLRRSLPRESIFAEKQNGRKVGFYQFFLTSRKEREEWCALKISDIYSRGLVLGCSSDFLTASTSY